MDGDEIKLSAEERHYLESLKEHPGWKVLVNTLLPQRVRQIERRTARYSYDNLDELRVDQARVKAYEGLKFLIDEFLHADDGRSNRRK